MLLSELVLIGKLGNSIDSEGFVRLRKTKNFKESYLSFSDIFLVFKDNRVRLVTLLDVSVDKGYKLRFKETDIVQDGISTGYVKVMLAGEDIQKEDETEDNWIGSAVYLSGEKTGQVIDVFNNGVYDVFICENEEGQEFMIPDVDLYVEKKTIGKLEVRNIDELIDL